MAKKAEKPAKAAKKAKSGGGFNFKKLMLEKGEKIGLGLCVAALLLFAVLGIMSAVNAGSASQVADKITKDSDRVIASVNATTGGTVPEEQNLDLIREVPTFNQYSPLAYLAKNDYFDPTAATNLKRNNPRLLGPVEYQVDLIRGSTEAIDLLDVQGKLKVAVLSQVEFKDNDLSKRVRKLNRGLANNAAALRMMNAAGGGAGGGMPPGGGPPGMGGGGPPGMGGMGMPGGRGRSPGGMGGMGGPGGGGFNPNGQRGNVVETVTYIDIDDKELDSKTLALTLYPLRMAVIHAAFPYKEQLKEYQVALKYDSLEAMLEDPNFSMKFKGFNVQRRRTYLDGKAVTDAEGREEGFRDLDWLDAAKDILIRKVEDEPNPEDQVFVMPPEDDELVIPLPKLKSPSSYEKLRLKPIMDTLEKQKKANTSKDSASQLAQRLQRRGTGEGRGSFFSSGGGVGGTGGGGAAANPPPGMPRPGGTPPGMPRPGGNPPGMGGNNPGNLYGKATNTIPDYWLVRFIDPTIEPGYAYEYRVQMKAANPNFQQIDKVVQPWLADKEELELKPWADKDTAVSKPLPVTPESNLYAISELKVSNDPGSMQYFLDKVDFQVQAWREDVRLSDSTSRGEPVGNWVVSDKLPTTRGEYIGKGQQVKLPLWSSSKMEYVLRQAVKTTGPVKPGTTQPKGKMGVNVDFTTGAVLLDFEGGKGDYLIPGFGNLPDNASVDALVLTPDGRLLARTSGIDLKDKEREDHLKAWESWVKEVEAKQSQFDQTGNDRLGSGRPGGPGGGGAP